MYFTLIFEDNIEGPSLTYDLVFHPCPVWYQGNDQIGIPEPRSPYYELGSVKFLLNILDEEFDKKRCNSVKIPAKLMRSLSLWFLSRQASVVSVYKNGKNTKNAIPIADTRQPKCFATNACPNSCKHFTKIKVTR